MNDRECNEVLVLLAMLVAVLFIWCYMIKLNAVTPDPFRTHRTDTLRPPTSTGVPMASPVKP